MKNLVGLLSRQVWTPATGQPGWEETTFAHQCGPWSRSRTFNALRQRKRSEPTPQLQLLEAPEYDSFCYVTNLSLTPWETHQTYGKRATCEGWIEEAKNQMGLAALRTDEFQANAALFQCAVLAYNLVRWMALLSGDEQLRRWEMQTVQTFLLRVAGKLACGSRQLTLKTFKEHLHALPHQRPGVSRLPEPSGHRREAPFRLPTALVPVPRPRCTLPAAVLRARETRIAGFGWSSRGRCSRRPRSAPP